jgi:hypothetical protein
VIAVAEQAVYVMYFINEDVVEVTKDWNTAKERLKGRKNKNKKFYDLQSAQEWLMGVTGKRITKVKSV